MKNKNDEEFKEIKEALLVGLVVGLSMMLALVQIFLQSCNFLGW